MGGDKRSRRASGPAVFGRMAAVVFGLALFASGCGDPEEPPPMVEPDAEMCAAGFDRVGDGCVDVDECVDEPGPCDPRTTCINLRGGFSCGACPDRYSGDSRVDDGGPGCVLDCPPGQRDGGGEVCAPRGACNPGYVLDAAGDCPPIECPEGEHFDGLDGCAPEGTCAPGFEPDAAGDCVAGPCPAGQHDDGTGACAPEGTCADGFTPDANGDCAPDPGCPMGEHPGGDGSCVPEGTCVDGYALDEAGDCAALACPGDDPHEPDDTPAEAAGATRSAVVGIACPDDPDHHRIDPGARCRVVATIEPVGGDPLDARLDLVDAGQQVLAAGQGGVARLDVRGPVFAAIAGQGVYRLRVALEGHDGGDGACVDVGACSPGYALDGAGDCADCADGFHDGGDGKCVPLGECSAGHRLGVGGVCAPVAECDAGERDDGTGVCAPEAAPCAGGFVEDGAGGCARAGFCAPGFAIDRLDRCRALAECPEGQRDIGDGGCGAVCTSGYHNGADPGVCLPEGDCAAGFVERGDGTCDRACRGPLVAAGAACVEAAACPADDDAEPDEPRALSPGTTKYGIVCPGDVDAFRLDPPVGCGARFILRFDGDEGALALEAGPEAAPVRGAPGMGGQRLVIAGLAGPVDVRVRGLDGEASARYGLRVDLDGHDGGDGRCQPLGECAVGYALAADGSGDCDRCGPGYVDGSGGLGPLVCVREGQCAGGFHDGGDGRCVPEDRCSPGYIDGDGARPGVICVREGDCAAGFHDGGEGECVPLGTCAPGHHDGDGPAPGNVCVPVGTCVEGFHDGNGAEPGNPCMPAGACVRGLHDGGDGVCVARGACSEGFLDRGDGACTVNALFDTACLAGFEFVFGGGGACVCAPGFGDGGDGQCVPLGTCSPGFRPGAPGAACVAVGLCAAGHHSTPWGECRPTVACPAGQRDDGIGRCVAVAGGDCAPGFAERGAICAAPPACGPGAREGGDGSCAPAGACADGFVDSANGCVPDGGCSAPSGFDGAPPIEVQRPVGGVACGPDVWRFDVPLGCGVEARLVADPAAGAVDLEQYDAVERLQARVEALDGTARLWLPPGDRRSVFLRVAPYPAASVDPVPYRLALVIDPLRCEAVCPPDLRPDGAGRCIGRLEDCAPGWHEGGDGTCVPVDRCTPGHHDGGDGGCAPFDECAPGVRLNAGTMCVPTVDCPPGQKDDGGGVCAAVCATGQGYHDGGDGTCVATPYCSAGHADDGGGRCIARVPGARCAPEVPAARPDGDGLCLLVGCPDGDDMTDALAEAEPIDVRLGGPTVVHGSLCVGDPGDWYRVLGGGRLRARLRFDHDARDMALRFLDADGAELAVADSGDDDEVIGLDDAPGEVIVEVTGVGAAASYRLDLVRD